MSDSSRSDRNRKEIERGFAALCASVCAAEGWRAAENGGVEVRLVDTGSWRRVDVEYREFGEDVLAYLFTEIGPAVPAEPALLSMALRLNFGLPQAGVAIRDDSLVLFDVVLADDPDIDEIESGLAYLAEAAESLERSLFGSDED